MNLVITSDGAVRCIYNESIDLNTLGRPVIARGSHIEPDENGCWYADMSPVDGPKLGPFDRRSDGLVAERQWLEENWVSPPGLH